MAKTHFVIAFVLIIPCLFTPSTSLNRDTLKYLRQMQDLKNFIESHRNKEEVWIRIDNDTGVIRPKCEVSPELTTSAIHVENRFMDRSPLEVIKYAWPRQRLYDNVSSTIDRNNYVRFCPETLEVGINFICVDNGCFPCSQKDSIPRHEELTASESVLCKNEYGMPPEEPPPKDSDDIEQELKINVSPTPGVPEGEAVSDSDVVRWIDKLEEERFLRKEFDDCHYSLELAKALKYVEKIRDKLFNQVWY